MKLFLLASLVASYLHPEPFQRANGEETNLVAAIGIRNTMQNEGSSCPQGRVVRKLLAAERTRDLAQKDTRALTSVLAKTGIVSHSGEVKFILFQHGKFQQVDAKAFKDAQAQSLVVVALLDPGNGQGLVGTFTNQISFEMEKPNIDASLDNFVAVFRSGYYGCRGGSCHMSQGREEGQAVFAEIHYHNGVLLEQYSTSFLAAAETNRSLLRTDVYYINGEGPHEDKFGVRGLDSDFSDYLSGEHAYDGLLFVVSPGKIRNLLGFMDSLEGKKHIVSLDPDDLKLLSRLRPAQKKVLLKVKAVLVEVDSPRQALGLPAIAARVIFVVTQPAHADALKGYGYEILLKTTQNLEIPEGTFAYKAFFSARVG